MAGPVLVTGANGFVGHHLVARLAQDNDVVAWGHRTTGEVRGNVRWHAVDLTNREAVDAAIRETRPSAVYHCAGLSHVADSWNDRLAPLTVNVQGTHHLLAALGRMGAGVRVLVTGSSTVYAASATPVDETQPLGPSSPYAVSKLAQEQLALHAAREDGLEVIVTRSFNHTGPGQRETFFTPGMARQIALIEAGTLPPVIRAGNLDAVRDMSDVRDVVAAYVALMRAGTSGHVYNVASGVGCSMRTILESLLALSHVRVHVETDPTKLRPVDVPYHVGDATLLRRDTGWEPKIAFERCLADVLDHWRAVVRAV